LTAELLRDHQIAAAPNAALDKVARDLVAVEIFDRLDQRPLALDVAHWRSMLVMVKGA
jgi:hypothetical protein